MPSIRTAWSTSTAWLRQASPRDPGVRRLPRNAPPLVPVIALLRNLVALPALLLLPTASLHDTPLCDENECAVGCSAEPFRSAPIDDSAAQPRIVVVEVPMRRRYCVETFDKSQDPSQLCGQSQSAWPCCTAPSTPVLRPAPDS